ncbi:monofunctional biosynthetic peptidoglycan transglycosylase [Actibacterium sp. D379-3]
MAKTTKTKKRPAKAKPATRLSRGARWLLRRVLRGAVVVFLAVVALLLLFRFVNPPLTHTIWSESRRLDGVTRQWVPINEVAPAAVRAVVAAEDANFCRHWGFDVAAIRAALDEGAVRGGSSISQQTAKNVFLWQGRSWIRKALEAVLTPMIEAAWPKRRILEVYLNVAEFGEGVFGINAAAHHYFRVAPADLTPEQGARLAVVLPDPKGRDAARLSPALRRHAARVQDGAATILADGRASCFGG